VQSISKPAPYTTCFAACKDVLTVEVRMFPAPGPLTPPPPQPP
jgi:hypothetical protein